MSSLEKIPAGLWRDGVYRDNGEKCRWVPVVQIETCLLALTAKGFWVFADEDVDVRLIRIDSPKVYPGLPLLEQSMTEISDQIVKGLKVLNLSEEEYALPYEWIVLCGLNHPSEHWQLAALEWCVTMEDIENIKSSLEEVALFGSSQHVQHLAKKLLKNRNAWNYEEMNKKKEEGEK